MALKVSTPGLTEYAKFTLEQARLNVKAAIKRHKTLAKLCKVLARKQEVPAAQIVSRIKGRSSRRIGLALLKELHSFSKQKLAIKAKKSAKLFLSLCCKPGRNERKILRELFDAYQIPNPIQEFLMNKLLDQSLRVAAVLDDQQNNNLSQFLTAICDKRGRLTELTVNNEVYCLLRIIQLYCLQKPSTELSGLVTETVRELFKALLKRPLVDNTASNALDSFAKQDELDTRVARYNKAKFGLDSPLTRIHPETDSLSTRYLEGLNAELRDLGKVHVWQVNGTNSDKFATGVARIKNIKGGGGVLVEVWDDSKNTEMSFHNKEPANTIHINKVNATRI
jgi:hypothetical protein